MKKHKKVYRIFKEDDDEIFYQIANELIESYNLQSSVTEISVVQEYNSSYFGNPYSFDWYSSELDETYEN
jgi:hypothetical protein